MTFKNENRGKHFIICSFCANIGMLVVLALIVKFEEVSPADSECWQRAVDYERNNKDGTDRDTGQRR